MGNKIVTRSLSHASLDLLDLHKHFPDRYPHCLESLQSSHASSRFNILFAYPQASICLTTDGLNVTGNYVKNNFAQSTFLQALDHVWSAESCLDQEQSELPFLGGWFLYLGYELVREIEPCLSYLLLPSAMPTAYAVRHPAAIIFDQRNQQYTLIAEKEYEHLLDEMSQDIHQLPVTKKVAGKITASSIENDRDELYLNGVARIKEYIREGDIFQANLSREWRLEVRQEFDTSAIYKALRKNNPAPFAGLSVFDNTAIISSSPERLVSVRDGIIQTRPIAGTRPRSTDNKLDREFADTLLKHPKEQAEHIMLLDLERNDLGRVSQYGTVSVDELMVLESYQHVHHIVSNIRGKVRTDASPVDIIKAVFPGGTITGCPKIRCMEILAELEQKPRSAYTGSFGYLNRNGSMDLNILIRTIIKQGDHLSIRAGAGIVADSEPEKELQETCIKAKGMLKALGAEV